MRILKTVASAALAAALGACGDSSPTAPAVGPPVADTAAFPGFDTSIYPGDAAMAAWRHPSSPYRWSGYYLPAPCHRDPTWSNKYATLTTMGWGLAAIYVGQQDWSHIPQSAMALGAHATRRATQAAGSQAFVACSESLLSADQGTLEADDAIAKLHADGFPDGSTVFLDVEYVTSVTDTFLAYFQAWIVEVLRDGHYRPGVYAAKANALTLFVASVNAARSAGSGTEPAFWIASSTNFSLEQAPSAVGYNFAKLWQGAFDVTQTWNGVTLFIDVDVAARESPSAPL